MKRLFVVGCSFTQYYWPTWADILGREYDHFENWAQPGFGNRAILERLTELVMSNNITKDDTIIVQWSEIHRHDVHHRMPMRLHRPHTGDGWNSHGNIFQHPGYTRQWIDENWKEFSYIYHSYNFIKLGRTLLESLPSTWLMTSFNDLSEAARLDSELSMYMPIFQDMLPPMGEFTSTLGYNKPYLIDEVTHNKFYDEHPTPAAHLDYLKAFVLPKLQKTVDEQWVQKAQDLLNNIKFLTDCRKVYKEIGWDDHITWVRGI